MDHAGLQSLCQSGQDLLQRMEYLAAERTLERAEVLALELDDLETLSRLYMPLQEARRQRRLRCGEGIVRFDMLAGPGDRIDPVEIIERHPHGQLLVAGWASIEPAMALRRLAQERRLYVETFLAAVFPVGATRAVAIVPTEDVALPAADSDIAIDDLLRRLPAHSIMLSESELPRGPRPGDADTFALTSALWERLHAPFLAAADMQVDPVRRLAQYRRAIEVDYACELAHQNLSEVARRLARDKGALRKNATADRTSR